MQILTTGQAAKICGVAPRTIVKWADSGELKAYRVPGSSSRRIPVGALREFLTLNNMPLDGLPERRVARLLVLGQRSFGEAIRDHIGRAFCVVEAVDTAFDLAFVAGDMKPDCVLVDIEHSPEQGLAVCCGLRRATGFANTVILAIEPERRNGDAWTSHTSVNEAFQRPFDVSLLAERVKSYLAPKLARIEEGGVAPAF